MTRPVLRFAPSPNGRLHLGHAYSALLNERIARDFGGTWLLRIENIDGGRCRPDYERAIYQDLAWLGLSWPEPVRRQSEHIGLYGSVLGQLRSRDLVYRCTCTRRDIAAAVVVRERESGRPWPRDPDGSPLYPGTCRGRMADATAPAAWRLDTDAARRAIPGPLAWSRFDPESGSTAHVIADPERWGDAVIVRKDVPTSYHLSVVADDDVQGVTHVVRGQDLEAATDLHALLQALLGLTAPAYHHHGLIRDEAGGKLAKSLGAPALAELAAAGATGRDIRRRLGFA